MGLPFTASWKPWVPRYPARFSSCRLVTTAGRLCPQQVNLHLQEEWVVLDHLDHQRQRQKRENNPVPPPWSLHHFHHPEKGGERGQADVLVTDLPPHTDWRVEVVCPPSPLSVRQTAGLLLLRLSSISRVSLLCHSPLLRGCGPFSQL